MYLGDSIIAASPIFNKLPDNSVSFDCIFSFLSIFSGNTSANDYLTLSNINLWAWLLWSNAIFPSVKIAYFYSNYESLAILLSFSSTWWWWWCPWPLGLFLLVIVSNTYWILSSSGNIIDFKSNIWSPQLPLFIDYWYTEFKLLSGLKAPLYVYISL